MSRNGISDDEIFARVRRSVSEILNVPEEEISRDSRFVEDLGADSFDNLSLFMALEEEFDQEISETAAAELVTVGSAVDLVRSQLAQA